MDVLADVVYWDQLPNRDEGLERIYNFLRALGSNNAKEAARLVYVKDMNFFIKVLHDSLLQYLDLAIEDEQWDDFEGKNLVYEIDDLTELDEDLSLPQFTGKAFEMTEGEELSVQLGLKGRITPIRLHFVVSGNSPLYYLKLQRITAK